MEPEDERVLRTGLSSPTEPSSTVSALTGFDPSRKSWPLCGYAPGHYMGRCFHCGNEFEGDKRALECLECAAASANFIIRDYAERAARPVPMILNCPACGGRHIDEGEFATKSHHTHACQHCGMVWRPAIGPTVGVQFLPGFKNAASAIEARSDATPESDAAEGESAVPQGDAR
jgi:hypothetical protein